MAGTPAHRPRTASPRSRGSAHRDEDFDRLFDLCLEDHDLLWRWDPALDGIESDREIAARLGTVNLHPRSWFLPFRDPQATAAAA